MVFLNFFLAALKLPGTEVIKYSKKEKNRAK